MTFPSTSQLFIIILRCGATHFQLMKINTPRIKTNKLADFVNTVEPGYIGLHNTSPIESDFLWYELVCHC
jgi:hypothetical protein